jgi:hypothetical protein
MSLASGRYMETLGEWFAEMWIDSDLMLLIYRLDEYALLSLRKIFLLNPSYQV